MEFLDNQIIEKYLSGSCSEAEVEQILKWIALSDANQKELFGMKVLAAKEQFNKLSQDDETNRAYNEFLRINKYKEDLKQQITKKIMIGFARYAAAIVLLIGFSTGIWFGVVKQPKSNDLITMSAGENEVVRQVILEDGTKVWLFEKSKIEYHEHFDKYSRTLSVEGKVYFEVAKDTKRPFRVDVGGYIVEALGTAFEVTNYKNKEQFDVLLVEGSVLIKDPRQKSLSTILPGQGIVVNTAINKFQLNQVDTKAYTSWINGVLEFDGMTFPEIAKILERYYDVKIILNAPESMTQHLVGSLSLKKDIATMMRAIQIVVPIKYDVSVDTYVYVEDF